MTRLYCHAGGSGMTSLTRGICTSRPLPSTPERANVAHLVTPMYVARQYIFVTLLARSNGLDLQTRSNGLDLQIFVWMSYFKIKFKNRLKQKKIEKEVTGVDKSPEKKMCVLICYFLALICCFSHYFFHFYFPTTIILLRVASRKE